MGLINPPRMRFLDKRVNLNKGAKEEGGKSGQTLGQNLGQNSDSEDEEDDILTLKRTNHDLEDVDLDPDEGKNQIHTKNYQSTLKMLFSYF